jgi:adenine-specific DNA-methyltransferase
MAQKPKAALAVEALTHDEARRRNIPTAEYQSVVDEQTRTPLQVAYLAGVNYLDRPATTILAGWKRGMISL